MVGFVIFVIIPDVVAARGIVIDIIAQMVDCS